ncbi:MAG: cytochrome c biogenesis protein CcdA [Planctomycetota bacterium]
MMNRLLLLLLALVAWSDPLHAQENKAHATLYVRAEGSDVKALVRIKIDAGWHLYHDDLGTGGGIGMETTAEWGGEGITWSPTQLSEPKKLIQKGLGPNGSDLWIWGHEGKLFLYAKGHFDSGAADASKVKLELSGLTCQDNGTCIPYSERVEVAGPGEDALFADFPADLAPGAKGPEKSGPSQGAHGGDEVVRGNAPPPESSEWNDASFPGFEPVSDQRGIWLMLVFAFIAGAILNVMPCVLPVVSIKVLSFVQQSGESKARVFQLGLAFAAGILAVFAVLASLAAFASKSWGEQFQDETFKIVMIAVVFAFSLSLFDVYELGVPSKVGEIASIKREGIYDAFFKGIMATVLATPCSGPFLGSTLAWALRQPPHVILLVFMTVGLGMAAPYVLLTSNTALLKFLPRPGAWMNTFKQATGFMLLGTVVFLSISVKPDLMVPMLALLVFVALGCWWWGKYATFEQTGTARLGTLLTALAITAGGAWVCFAPLKTALSHEVGSESLTWYEFDPVEFERLHQAGTPVMLEFTADWCANCKANEAFVYNSEQIVALVHRKGVVPMRVDLTGNSPRTKAGERLRDLLGASSIPFLSVHPPGDQWMHPVRFYDIVRQSKLAKLLESFPDSVAAK